MVHFLMLDASIKSFRDYADMKVIPYIERQLANTKRVDVTWDRNPPYSLKATTRQRREQESDSGCDMMELDISEKLEQLSAERKQQGGTVPFSCNINSG